MHLELECAPCFLRNGKMQWEDQDSKQTTRSTFAAFFVIVVFCSGVPLSALPSDMVATTLANPLALTFREFKTLKAWGMPNEVSGDPYSRAIEWNTVQSEMYVVWLDSDQYELFGTSEATFAGHDCARVSYQLCRIQKGPKLRDWHLPSYFQARFWFWNYMVYFSNFFFKLFW